MLTSAFSAASTGLRTMQAVVDTSSVNVANAKTPGFRRREEALFELLGGGVSSTTVHRFSEARAVRLAELAGDVAYQETLAQALRRNQAQLSEASSRMGAAFDSLRESVGALTSAPGDLSGREVAAGKAQALASTANAHLQQLQQSAQHLAHEQQGVEQAARVLLAQTHELNQAVARHGPLPELRDSLAQRGSEFAQLTGAQLRFERNGSASLSIEGRAVLDAAGPHEWPAELGGRAGALSAARALTLEDHAALEGALQAFAQRMNAANHRGTDLDGNPGGDLFALDHQGLRFVGSARGIAVSDPGGLNGHNAQSFLNLQSLAIDVGGVAVRSAAHASTAQALADTHSSVFNALEREQRQQEGVDLDQETIRIKQAQRVYEANAKLMQVADAMLGSLLSIRA
jgi:flagellar hook-associated protein FlgK